MSANPHVQLQLDQPLEEVLRTVASLDRDACKTQLKQMGRLTMDFTEEFLEAQSLDRLRHIVMAACLQARKTAHLRKRA